MTGIENKNIFKNLSSSCKHNCF